MSFSRESQKVGKFLLQSNAGKVAYGTRRRFHTKQVKSLYLNRNDLLGGRWNCQRHIRKCLVNRVFPLLNALLLLICE